MTSAPRGYRVSRGFPRTCRAQCVQVCSRQQPELRRSALDDHRSPDRPATRGPACRRHSRALPGTRRPVSLPESASTSVQTIFGRDGARPRGSGSMSSRACIPVSVSATRDAPAIRVDASNDPRPRVVGHRQPREPLPVREKRQPDLCLRIARHPASDGIAAHDARPDLLLRVEQNSVRRQNTPDRCPRDRFERGDESAVGSESLDCDSRRRDHRIRRSVVPTASRRNDVALGHPFRVVPLGPVTTTLLVTWKPTKANPPDGNTGHRIR